MQPTSLHATRLAICVFAPAGRKEARRDVRRAVSRRRSAGLAAVAGRDAPVGRGRADADQWCVPSRNCSSSVEPFSAAVEACASMVVVTASK